MRAYLVENRYSHLEDLRRVIAAAPHDVDTPETDFERRVQLDLAAARDAHHHEELGLALHRYEALRELILRTANPRLPGGIRFVDAFEFPKVSLELVDVMMQATTHVLRGTPRTSPAIPPSLVNPSPIPAGVAMELDKTAAFGFHRGGSRDDIKVVVDAADAAAVEGRWDVARDSYLHALRLVPDDDLELRGHLSRDLAVLEERAGRADTAADLARMADSMFERAGSDEGRHRALTTLAGVLDRQGRADAAASAAETAASIARARGVGGGVGGGSGVTDVASTAQPMVVERLASTTTEIPTMSSVAIAEAIETDPSRLRVPEAVTARRGIDLRNGSLTRAGAGVGDAIGRLDHGELGTGDFLDHRSAPNVLTLLDGAANPITIDLTASGVGTSLQKFYEVLRDTTDISLLHAQALPAPAMVTYLPHLYFFVLPMSIGDCHASMGAYEEAEEQYTAALSYPYLNTNVEVVRVWTRLAELYVAWGDSLYRRARNDPARFAAAREKYERLVLADGTLPGGSALYQGRLAPMGPRAQAVLSAADPLALDENPAIASILVEVRSRLAQLTAGLNFFGFSADYVPPFSFEYLQNTARHFAQHAATVERTYIQFKSQAENEEFRRDQLDQQVELARASVDLERLNVAEAQAGARVAQASVSYAETQRQNAIGAQASFAAVRWELLELSALESWSSAAAVDEDDEVQQTISGFTYYNTSSKDRSDVLYDLASRRTRITHDLEAARLAREVASATAYKAVAQAQLQQAAARVEVARQRVAIAQLQQRHAEENRDFLDMREFNARLWYELARALRRISQRYLDMAVEIAALMERAYSAETGRTLDKIKFDYRNAALHDLLGADQLLSDIDFFTLDFITTTKSKKAPIKVALSLADEYPMAFEQLKQTGHTFFETRLEQLDRLFPGYYLQKLHNVELVFVGLTGSGAIHGTLRNIGVSTFRDQSGNTVQQVYPSDVMPLSQYEVRQDVLVFRTDPSQLRLFENNGVATMWQIDLPRGANDFDPAQILDVHLVMYFDAFHDEVLEASTIAALPTSGSASRGVSLRFNAPDELFYLRSNGEAELRLDERDFPFSQTDLRISSLTLRAAGDAGRTGNLTLRITPESTGTPLSVTTDAAGTVTSSGAASALATLVGRPVLDRWTIAIRPEDNAAHTGADGRIDLSSLTDVQLFLEYAFTYR